MADTVMVTGGCGFLGSHLCENLLSAGKEVICVDNLSSGRKNNIQHLRDNSAFKLNKADICHPQPLPNVDEIYHLASMASPADFTEYPVKIALTNTRGTKQLLDHARACGARILFASTSEVYGDPQEHPQRESYNGNVDIRGPRGCYDESKRFGETLITAYKEQYGIDARTVRIFNTYGPRMREDDGRVVPTFVSQALANEPLTVYGDGQQTRSFCYISDLVQGIRKIMDADTPNHEVYNLGRANERTINELADLIINLCDASSEITYEPLPEDDPRRRKPDISRINSEFGWQPEIALPEGLSKTIEYMSAGGR